MDTRWHGGEGDAGGLELCSGIHGVCVLCALARGTEGEGEHEGSGESEGETKRAASKSKRQHRQRRWDACQHGGALLSCMVATRPFQRIGGGDDVGKVGAKLG